MEISRRLFSLVCLVALSSLVTLGPSSAYELSDAPDDAVTAPDCCGARLSDCAPDPATCPGGCSQCCACACKPAAPWTLPQPCFLQAMNIKMGGWLQQGITFNSYHSDDGFNGPVATNDFDDQYQMNQLWLFFDRPANTDGCGFALGGHVRHDLRNRLPVWHQQRAGRSDQRI